ncbi:pirin family protein [Williamsia sp.]|uniref:pirin family protein n=1 Tax=Williamsia sp. TaxID=1872085 RepID=UPI001A2F7F17|nr:pirin family protein [Williamsia sp.]MBJ7289309.1 pirin family protein [Williamsia sp.]
MSNLEQHPVEQECVGSPTTGVEVLTAREVPLGGPRAMLVRRTLPQRQRSLIGAWCFVDHYGPEDITRSAGMDVAPHPHTGLQTVSWLFSGEVEHRDSAGVHAMVRPGELNLMSAGAGITHSEVSTPDTTILHGAQLWVALPESARHSERGFQHHAPDPVAVDGAVLRVFLGELAGERSPVITFTPLLGAEIVIDPHATISLDVSPDFEHGVLSDQGDLRVSDTDLANGDLAYVGVGASEVTITNTGSVPARCLLLGGEPFTEEIIMWWNFVGRTHEEIAAYREQWEAHADRFGSVQGYIGPHDRIPAPTLPNTVLRPRSNPAPRAQIPTDHRQDS